MTETTALVPTQNVLDVQKAVELSREMQAIIDAAYKKTDELRETFVAEQGKDFKNKFLSIYSREVFMNGDDFLEVYSEFELKRIDRENCDYPYRAFIHVDGVLVHALLTREQAEKALPGTLQQ